MAWQQSPQTAEMVSEAQVGTTLCVVSKTYEYELRAEVDWSLNRLRLTVVSGEYGLQCDWWDMCPQSDHAVTELDIQAALGRWLLHASSRASRQERRLTAYEAMLSLATNLESLLA